MPTVDSPPTRGHRKRERTRRQLLEAGIRALAAHGEALTVSDVVAEAEVSNGTFYNYFVDREALIDALAEHLVRSLAASAAAEPIDDPALRFAVATSRVLRRSLTEPAWGRVVLRLLHRPAVVGDLDRYLRDDLAEGHAQGRFETGADDATVDQVIGLIVMTIRRIIDIDIDGEPRVPRRAVARALRALGIEPAEAKTLARDGWLHSAAPPERPPRG